jgi:hypothetical protein
MDDRRPLCLGPIEVAVGLAHDHVRIGAHMAVPLSTPRCGSLGAARARTAERTSCSGERERRVCRQQVRRRVGVEQHRAGGGGFKRTRSAASKNSCRRPLPNRMRASRGQIPVVRGTGI